MFLAAGITDFADASSATNYGLFTDSGFGIIPDGGSPVPVDWSIARLSYDSVLLGSEKSGGGFGSANAYLTQEISGGGDGGDDQDTTAQSLRSSEQNLQLPSEEYTDAGVTAQDDTDGDISDDIDVSGADFDRNIARTYLIKYNVSDAAGNAADEVVRSVTVEAPTQPGDITPPVITLIGGQVTITVGDEYSDAGATARDDTDGDISDEIKCRCRL